MYTIFLISYLLHRMIHHEHVQSNTVPSPPILWASLTKKRNNKYYSNTVQNNKYYSNTVKTNRYYSNTVKTNRYYSNTVNTNRYCSNTVINTFSLLICQPVSLSDCWESKYFSTSFYLPYLSKTIIIEVELNVCLVVLAALQKSPEQIM